MSERLLPKGILSFFERTTRDFSSLYKPSWLVSEVGDAIWVVDDASGDIRWVDGELKGGARINWQRRFPLGLLTDDNFNLVLTQAKTIIVWAHDGAVQTNSTSVKSVVGFHIYMMWMIEFLAVRYGNSFLELGFSILSTDDVLEFLEVYEEDGVCGVGGFIQRWEGYLKEKIESGEGFYSRAVRHLLLMNAYDLHGALQMGFVGEAIGADAKRLSSSSAFKEYIHKNFDQVGGSGSNTSNRHRVMNNVATWILRFCRLVTMLPYRVRLTREDLELLPDIVRPFRSGDRGRTKTLPLNVGKQLISGCCHWLTDIYPSMKEYIGSVISTSTNFKGVGDASLFGSLNLACASVDYPQTLNSLANIHKNWRGNGCQTGTIVRANLPFPIFLMRLHTAVCFCLISMLSCCRRNEVVELSSNSSFEVDGRCYLSVDLRKSGEGLVREEMEKPVPKIIHECLQSLSELKVIWSSLVDPGDPLFKERAFFKVNCRGAFPFRAEDVYTVLSELSEFLMLNTIEGEIWIVLPHQLRRFFAMTFFHFAGSENSLPALSWFMGHDNIEQTWVYVREGLSGREISASEAALAASAVCSADRSNGASKLREIVRDHFGVDKISIMPEDEVRSYLEVLADKGIFTARPIQIKSGKTKIYTVLISILEANFASS